MVLRTHPRTQRGIALITALLLLLLLLSLSLGFTLMVTNEQQLRGVDLDHAQAFYAAYGAMEKLNADVGTLFETNYAPTGAQINALAAAPPVIPGVNFFDPNNSPSFSGYQIAYPTDANGNPQATAGLITQGQYQGFQGLITNYTIIINAQTQNYSLTTGAAGTVSTNKYGSEVRLLRTLQTVGIPVFQFGIFSQTDLSFFPGPNFSFGGVVATNGNLYLAAGNTLTLSAQTSAFGDVIRDRLANGLTGSAYQSAYAGTVNQTTSVGSGSYRSLGFDEGSINLGPSLGCPIPPGGGTPNPNWTTISISNYNGVLRDGAFGCSRGTGAKNLQLPLVSAGASGIDLIKLPPAAEDVNNSPVYVQRYYTYPSGTNYAMLRILIADTPSEITTLPGKTTQLTGSNSATQPVPLFCAPPAAPGNPCTSLSVAGYTGVLVSGVNAPSLPNAGETGAPASLPPWAASAGTPSSGNNTADWFTQGQPRLWGYIKIEYQDNTSAGIWTDVTKEILSLGTTGRNLSNGNWLAPSGTANPGNPTSGAGNGDGTVGTCHEPYRNAVLRFQRVVDKPSNFATYPCGYPNPTAGQNGPSAVSTTASDYIPNMLFDPREALLRDVSAAGTPPTGMTNSQLALSGVMYYVELDMTNLGKWFTGAIGTKGAPPSGTAGFLVYFSDRRSNQPCSPVANCPPILGTPTSRKLGNLGYEDFVNPANANGAPNGALDAGEDLNGANATPPGGAPVSLPLDLYGGNPVFEAYPLPGGALFTPYQMPNAPANENCTPGTPVAPANICPAGGATPTQLYTNTGVTAPYTAVGIAEARDNPALFFRRALKLTDAAAFSLGSCGTGVPCGLTISSENPVYVEGNYNATGGSCSGSPVVCTYTGTEAPSAILADAVTLLSINWNDIKSYLSPYDGTSGTTNRAASTTYYRVAILAGKGLSFPLSAVAGTPPQDFGTDGGVHNFLRYIENWGAGGGQTLAYNGSIVSFFFNTQATGVYKCCTAVYSPPSRGYAFDTKFLTPSLLPPRTPTFRDINTLGFTQLILPNQLY